MVFEHAWEPASSWVSGAIGLFLTVIFGRITVGADHATAVEAFLLFLGWNAGLRGEAFVGGRNAARKAVLGAQWLTSRGSQATGKGKAGRALTGWFVTHSPQKGRRPGTQKEPDQPQAKSPSRLPCFCFSWHVWQGTFTLRT